MRGLVPSGALRPRGGAGYSDLIEDVSSLGSFLVTNWAALEEDVANRACVNQALATAEQVHIALGEADEVKENDKGTAAVRTAAWALTYASYAQGERGIAFLRFHEDDAKVIAPARCI